MDYVMLGSVGLGAIAGLAFRRFAISIILSTFIGLGLAIAYHIWLNADPARGDAMEGVGYFLAFAYPLAGCMFIWMPREIIRHSRK